MRGWMRRTGCRVARDATAAKHAQGSQVLDPGGLGGTTRIDPGVSRITELTARRSIFGGSMVHALETKASGLESCVELGQRCSGVRVAQQVAVGWPDDEWQAELLV